MQNGSHLQQRWAGWREEMGHPKGQNQARDTGELGLSPRWGFPLRLNSWKQERSPRESGIRARSCKRLRGTRQDGAHLLVQAAALQGLGLHRTKVPLLRSLLHFSLISRLLSSKAQTCLTKKKNQPQNTKSYPVIKAGAL